jgi:hypothetical protein
MSSSNPNIIHTPEEYNQLCQDYISTLYQGISGFISYQPGEKEAGEEKKVFLTYGEILYPSVDKFLNYIGDVSEEDVFYDLGSGIGKVALQTFLRTPIKKACGIEFSETRNRHAEQVYKQVHTEFPELTAGRDLKCLTGNFLEIDISDATIIYTCSTCFNEELLSDIGQVIDRCPNIRYVVSLKQIPSKLSLDRNLEIECTWDKTKCYVYGPKKAEFNLPMDVTLALGTGQV